MPFRHPFTVRFSEVDGAGIVFFSRIFEYCHAAYEASLASIGAPLGELIARREWLLPLVHAEADFKRPMRLGEQLVTEVSVGAMGETSVSMAFRVVDEQGVVRATARCVHVCLTPEFTPRALDAAFAAALRGLEG